MELCSEMKKPDHESLSGGPQWEVSVKRSRAGGSERFLDEGDMGTRIHNPVYHGLPPETFALGPKAGGRRIGPGAGRPDGPARGRASRDAGPVGPLNG